MKRSTLAVMALFAACSYAFGQEDPKRQYVVRPPNWVDVTFDTASEEFEADTGKKEIEQRWVKFDIAPDSEVLVSTAVHGVIRLRLASVLINEVEWKYAGESLLGNVPDDLIQVLKECDSLPPRMRAQFRPNLPTSLSAEISFSVFGTPIKSSYSPYPSPRPVSENPQKPYDRPAPLEPDEYQDERPAAAAGYAVVPKRNFAAHFGDYEYERTSEYEQIGKVLANFVEAETNKAEAVAQSFLPMILGNLGHEILALNLSNTEFDKLPQAMKDHIDQVVELQPMRFGFSSYEDYERARDAGFRLSIVPAVSVSVPNDSSAIRSSFPMTIRIRP
jgi:hypothetical protein